MCHRDAPFWGVVRFLTIKQMSNFFFQFRYTILISYYFNMLDVSPFITFSFFSLTHTCTANMMMCVRNQEHVMTIRDQTTRQERASSLLLPCWKVCVSLFIYQSIMFYLITTKGQNKWNQCQNRSCGMWNFGGGGHQRVAVITTYLLQAEPL